MPVCEVCEGEDFTEILGHFYCSNCQTQSQTVRVVEAEDELAYGQFAGHSNLIREKRPTETSKKKVRDDGRPWSIYEAYQIIIQHQVEALVKLGAHETLKDVVFKLWVNYLSRLQVAFSDKPPLEILNKYSTQREKFPGTTKKPLIKNVTGRKKRRKTVGVSTKTAEKIQLASEMKEALQNEEFYEGDNPLEQNDDDKGDNQDSDDDYSSEEDDDDTHWGKRGKRADSRSEYKMQMKYTLVFCYIGLLYTNPGTTLSDLVRWARKGKIPYLKAMSLLPEDFKFNMQDSRLFGLGILPTTAYLRRAIGMICRFLGLATFPKFPFTELISKYILMLDLPAEMLALVINLYKSKNVMTDYQPTKQFNKIPFWEGLALSYIIITLKLYLGLNDHTERSESRRSQTNVPYIFITLKLYLGLNDHTERVLSSYSRELMKLTDHCHQLFIWEDWVNHIKTKFASSDILSGNNSKKLVESLDSSVDGSQHTVIPKNDKLQQPEVREKIVEPLLELAKRWKNKRRATENQPQEDTTHHPVTDLTNGTLQDEDPVGYLLGHYGGIEDSQEHEYVDTSKNNQCELIIRGDEFRKSSIKHLSNPESFIDDLDKHGLSDYTIQSSCASSAESDEDWEPDTGNHDNPDWDFDSPPQKKDKKAEQDTQSSSQTLLKKFIKDNVKSVPSRSKVKDKEKYQHVIDQIEKMHQNFLLTFELEQWTDCLSYNWLLQVCSDLIDCPISDLRNEVKKVEMSLFAEIDDVSRRGRHNFKRMKRMKTNDFTKRLKVF